MHCLRIHVTVRSALDELAGKVDKHVEHTLRFSMADFVLVRVAAAAQAVISRYRPPRELHAQALPL